MARPPRPTFARAGRARAAAVAGVLVGILLGSAACGSAARRPASAVVSVMAPTSGPAPPSTEVSTAPSTSTTKPAAPRTTAAVAPAKRTTLSSGPTGVGTVTLAVVDPTRPTVQFGRTLSASRSLPTVVRYPAVGPVGTAEGALATGARGPWPLVIFAPGYNASPWTYAHLLHAWAAAGFVVAAPSFPLETAGGPLDENDLNNEPVDISVVITAVLAQSAGPLAGLVDRSRVAVAGHSDGAEAALAAGYLGPPEGDRRIGPVISMAAQGILGGPAHDPAHPLLVIQGTQDTIVPPAQGDAVYAAAGPPRYKLLLLGGDHLPPIAGNTPWRPIVEQVSIDFLRTYLGGRSTVATIEADANRPRLTALTADA